jgi:transcriptional regulator with XRE-family HTH domain
MTIPGPKPRAYRLRDYHHALRTLDAIRDDRDATYADIAAVIGAGRGEVGAWLRGTRMPGGRRLVEIAAALGYDLALIPREDA